METPVVVKPIPNQVVNERAAYGPFDLNEFIKAPDHSTLHFTAGVKSGHALPKGMICTSDGILTGIPGMGTQGNYEVDVTASNDAGSVITHFLFTIKPSLIDTNVDYVDKLKSQVWQALDQKMPIPDLSELYERPITAMDIYYLLERWTVLKIWDAFNLDLPGEKRLLTLPGASKHYDVYDRGSCIVGHPKELFSHERTILDGLITARAMAREVYQRNWTVELVGVGKMTRAAWVELQIQGDLYGKSLEIINFNPTPDDVKLYNAQVLSRGPGLE